MKHWSSAFFPLSLLLTLTLLTFWLRYVTEMDAPKRDGKHRHDPDYILSNTVARKLDLNGQLKYTLRAVDIRHYPDDDTTDLTMPRLTHQNHGSAKPPLTVSARRGHLSNDNKQVDLYEDVRIHRPPSGKYEELTATMNALTVFPDDEIALTKSPVRITQGKSWVKGVGMRVNQRTQTYVIESRVLGLMESKPAGKKKS
jgi:lipopolysaccharide export system protein LptC